jgi:hypothetical protein
MNGSNEMARTCRSVASPAIGDGVVVKSCDLAASEIPRPPDVRLLRSQSWDKPRSYSGILRMISF